MFKDYMPSVEMEAQLMGLYIPEDTRGWTDEDILLLNAEVTEEIQTVIDQLLLEKARMEAEAFRPREYFDREALLNAAIPVFEEYIRVDREHTKLNVTWERLKYARASWWSLFKEEMDWNWLPFDRFVGEMDKRLAMGFVPTEDQWNQAMRIKQQKWQFCLQIQESRRAYTYSIYQNAMKATQRCREYWDTIWGEELTQLKSERTSLWNTIMSLDVTWEDYNNLISSEINPYFTAGEVGDVDTMELMASNSVEVMDILEETHAEEMREFDLPESRGSAFWSRRNERKQSIQDSEDEYMDGWVRWLDGQDGLACSASFTQPRDEDGLLCSAGSRVSEGSTLQC